KTDDPLQMYLADIYTVTGSLAGVPGISMPCGRICGALPVGLQLFGPAFAESRILQLAHAFEQAGGASLYAVSAPASQPACRPPPASPGPEQIDSRQEAVRDLQPILSKLACAQAEFLRAADPIAPPLWHEQPQPGCWSAGQLVAHLSDVERGVRGYADRIIRKAPLPVPLYQRLHVPLALVEARVVKRKV